METVRETIELPNKTIIVTHKTGYINMFWYTAIRPFLRPIAEIPYQFRYKALLGGAYGIFAYMQGFFEPQQVAQLFVTPKNLVEGLIILVFLDFIAGSIRAIIDSRIRFHPKKWMKTFYKSVMYSIGIIAVTVGANMFPDALGWFQYVLFLILTGHEIWSVLKHVKMTAFARVAFKLYKKKGQLDNIDWPELWDKVDEEAAKEFAESQAYYFGNEDVTVIKKEKEAA